MHNDDDTPTRDTRVSRRTFVATTAVTGSIAALSTFAATPRPATHVAPPRETSFDADWRFFRGDAAGAERPAFDDTAWRIVDLPHDWSIEDVPGAPKTSAPWVAPAATWNAQPRRPAKPNEFIMLPEVPAARLGGPPHKVGPFDADASPGTWGSGWTIGGTGWYRKRFAAPALAKDERLEIRFDGVYHDCEVWLNGISLGTHDHGHSGFAFDLTPHLRRDGPNIVAVRVKNEGFTSRWYNGSGIYRHVWLSRTHDIRVPLWGVFASTPRVSREEATVRVAVEIETLGVADAAVTASLAIRDSSGRTVGTATGSAAVIPGKRATVILTATLPNPRLWSPVDPSLHSAEVTLTAGGAAVDHVVTPFGIRAIAVDARSGLTINGEPVKLKGACLHIDHGILGSASYDRAEIRKIELLKANGYNAIRCSHNLYAPAFYDACDRLGMIVIDEMFDVWNEGKFGIDLGAERFKTHWRGDVADFIRRDRNHPSIVFWSIGNEIPERNTPLGVETAAALRAAVLALDNTRLITAALAPGPHGAEAEPSRRSLDVVGYNYMQFAYEKDHADNPGMVFMGTEQYAQDIHDAWRKVERYPWLIGDFTWTAIDYIGEVGAGSSQLRRNGTKGPASPLPFTIFDWDFPAFSSGCGEIDLIGLKKPQGLYRDVLWDRSTLELVVRRPPPVGFYEDVGSWAFPDALESWTWPTGTGSIAVNAYTTGDEVRLLLDGREIGRKRVTAADKLIAAFDVTYRPGVLAAVAYRDGREVARKTLETVGAPAKLRLRAERARVAATPGELAYVYAEVCDDRGRLVPDAQARLTFGLTGPARLLATGAANPRGLESFTDPACTTFHGVAQAILTPTGRRGEARLSVTSPGLAGTATEIAFG